jgi:Tfp pilus assembly protein PilF
LDEAIAAFRRAAELADGDPALKEQIVRDLRETERRAALGPDPSAPAGAGMPPSQVGDVVRDHRQRSAPISLVHPQPSDEAEALTQRGRTLCRLRDLPGAVKAFREAVRLLPDEAVVHNNLGSALAESRRLREAIAEFREAIRLKPDYVGAYINLGNALHELKELPAAAAAYREAIRLKPDDARVHCHLGHVLRSLYRFEEALAAFQRGHELGTRQPGWFYPSARWVEECRRLVELDAKLNRISKGQSVPADAAERLTLARLAHAKHHYAVAARLFTAALAERPELANDPASKHRYLAACCAALTAAGQGEGGPPLADDDRAGWRRRALDWLRTDLNAWELRARSPIDGNRTRIPIALEAWKTDPDLASLRDESALAALTETDRKAFSALWSEVDRLIEAAKGPPVPRGKAKDGGHVADAKSDARRRGSADISK